MTSLSQNWGWKPRSGVVGKKSELPVAAILVPDRGRPLADLGWSIIRKLQEKNDEK
jgi:hypothetical protein